MSTKTFGCKNKHHAAKRLKLFCCFRYKSNEKLDLTFSLNFQAADDNWKKKLLELRKPSLKVKNYLDPFVKIQIKWLFLFSSFFNPNASKRRIQKVVKNKQLSCSFCQTSTWKANSIFVNVWTIGISFGISNLVGWLECKM